jgi:hypothetical protein
MRVPWRREESAEQKDRDAAILRGWTRGEGVDIRALSSRAAQEAKTARLLRAAAGGDARAGRELDPELRAFLYGYARQGEMNGNDAWRLSQLGDDHLGDLVMELPRFRYYGSWWLDPREARGELGSWVGRCEPNAIPPACPFVVGACAGDRVGGAVSDKTEVKLMKILRMAPDGSDYKNPGRLAGIVEGNLRQDEEVQKRLEQDGHDARSSYALR